MLSRRQTAKSGDLSYEQQQTYSDYYDTYSGQTRPNAEILLNGADFQSADCAQYEVGSYTGEEDGSTRDNALIWNSADGSFTYTIQVPETGVYSIHSGKSARIPAVWSARLWEWTTIITPLM